MKQGKTLLELGQELERQRNARKDYIADTRSLEFTTDENEAKITVFVEDKANEFTVTDLAHQQIASRLQIPFKYYQKMQKNYPMLLDENVNAWFQRTPERRMW